MTDNKKEIKNNTASGIEAYKPDQIAKQVLEIGVKKTRYPAYKTFTLGLMGGVFISFGAMYELYIMAHPEIGSGVANVISPLFYAVGYIIAFITGAEVFTTNNLSAMGWASGQLNTWDVARNWTIVLFANLIGSAFIVTLFYFSGLSTQYDFALIDVAKTITSDKLSYDIHQVIILGIFGNMFICSGLWLAMAGRTVVDKFLALLIPVAAVPALNFQHSTGNMFQFFLALITETDGVSLELPSEITFWAVTSNLFFVSIGNIIGGGVFIAIIYYFVFLKETKLDN